MQLFVKVISTESAHLLAISWKPVFGVIITLKICNLKIDEET